LTALAAGLASLCQRWFKQGY